MRKQNIKGLTFVELIVVMLIVTILWTIGLVAFQWHSRDTRDTARLSDLEQIEQGLELYFVTEWNVPLPENNIKLTAWGKTIQYQWDISELNLSLIWFSGDGHDPKDETPYVYSSDGKDFQLMGLLEEDNGVTAIWKKYPFFKGKKLGIFLDDTTGESVHGSGVDIDLINTSTVYKVYDSSNTNDYFTWASDTLWRKLSYRINGTANCKEILEKWVTILDGTYTTAIRDDLSISEVYCDMTTDGGWWTAVVMLADSTTVNMFQTGTSWLVPSVTEDIWTIWDLDYFWVDDDDKDILMRWWSSDPAIHAVYNTWSVIYNYLKRDIENLTRLEKQTGPDASDSTRFSSIPLQVKYLNNNQVFILDTLWGQSLSSNNSHYLMISQSWVDYYLDFFEWNGFNSWNHSEAETVIGTPSRAYYDSGVNLTDDHLFDSQNYMVVFLR